MVLLYNYMCSSCSFPELPSGLWDPEAVESGSAAAAADPTATLSSEAYSCSIVNHLLLGQVLFGVLDDLLLVGVLLLGLDVLSLDLLEGGLAQRRGDHLRW